MKQGQEKFKVVKDNPNAKNKNYIFQNNKITRVGFFVILSLLIIGVVLIFSFNNQ